MSAFPHELGAPASLPASCTAADYEPPTGTPALPVTTRRHFVKATLSAATTLALGSNLPSISAATVRDLQSRGLIDTNVTLGRWPFRRLPLDETSALAAKLRKHGVAQAWAGSFDALLHEDIAAANARLAEECRRQGRGLLVPFGSVNPKLPGWEEDFRRCAEQYNMPGLRLHPHYHGYKLDDPAFAKLLSVALERRVIIQIAVSMEDERMQSPLARVAHVDTAPFVTLLGRFPKLPVALLNWQRAVNGDLVKKLAASGEVYFEIASLEGVGGLTNLLRQVPPQRVLFGSHAPFFYFESALLKLKESALEKEHDSAIRGGNARRLLTHA